MKVTYCKLWNDKTHLKHTLSIGYHTMLM